MRREVSLASAPGDPAAFSFAVAFNQHGYQSTTNAGESARRTDSVRTANRAERRTPSSIRGARNLRRFPLRRRPSLLGYGHSAYLFLWRIHTRTSGRRRLEYGSGVTRLGSETQRAEGACMRRLWWGREKAKGMLLGVMMSTASAHDASNERKDDGSTHERGAHSTRCPRGVATRRHATTRTDAHHHLFF